MLLIQHLHRKEEQQKGRKEDELFLPPPLPSRLRFPRLEDSKSSEENRREKTREVPISPVPRYTQRQSSRLKTQHSLTPDKNKTLHRQSFQPAILNFPHSAVSGRGKKISLLFPAAASMNFLLSISPYRQIYVLNFPEFPDFL